MTTITPPPRPAHPFFTALNYKPAAWEEQALCRRFPNESDAWTSGKGGGDDAIEICKTRCPVRQACLDAALREEDMGNLARIATIRGGLRPEERGVLIRALRAARAKVAEENAARAAAQAEEVAA
ncbi:WhiB family transcriptional regulator [Oerskovia sp. Sa1BUA8]|uniref:WhiB family transcriptional regulator n=1 Tax=Oerskovia douganii TaxID=2762210 RepID=A0A9D5UB06_9CELL|nr:WhiB family transcriptional regulator [Oerskovia douganii]MBE7701225.1 WhiB family transcriptional regulator [Oerskovia douganii]